MSNIVLSINLDLEVTTFDEQLGSIVNRPTPRMYTDQLLNIEPQDLVNKALTAGIEMKDAQKLPYGVLEAMIKNHRPQKEIQEMADIFGIRNWRIAFGLVKDIDE